MSAPSIDDAYAMGAKGGPAVESERIAFEAWMRGHCWSMSATWNGSSYLGPEENGKYVCQEAIRTRQLWAAWRDRAALSSQKAQRLNGENSVLRDLLRDALAVICTIDGEIYEAASRRANPEAHADLDKLMDALLDTTSGSPT